MKFLFDMIPRFGRIEGNPTDQLGEGGNYLPLRSQDQSDSVKRLLGKATEGNDIDIVSGKKFTFVRFEVDPVTGINYSSRSELAPGLLVPFDRQINIRMVFRVKASQTDSLTGYVLQFWQPVISPIAGVRVSNGRLEVVGRSIGLAGSKKLTSGWNKLNVSVRPSNQLGLLSASGDITGRVEGRLNGGSQAGLAVSDVFRPKFGWYGFSSQSVVVDVRRFELSMDHS